MQAVTELGQRLGFAAACAAVGLPKATYYRRLKPAPPRTARRSHRALGADERRGVLDVARRQLLLPVDDNYTSPSVAVERPSLPVVVAALCLASSLR